MPVITRKTDYRPLAAQALTAWRKSESRRVRYRECVDRVIDKYKHAGGPP